MKIRDRIKELRRVKACELFANPRNWRTHPKKQQDALLGILAEIGYADAILARELPSGELEIVDGHLRAETTPDMEVPVLILDLNEDEAKKLLTVLDPLAAMAEANKDALGQLLMEIDTQDAGLQKMLDELAASEGINLFEEGAEELQGDLDAVPEAPADPITKPGDLWILGEHRLLCGDSADESGVRRLLDGRRATCIFTDPPYGVSIGKKNVFLNSFQPSGRNLDDIKDDDLSSDELKSVLLPAFKNIRSLVMADDCSVYVTAPQGGDLGMMMMMMCDAGLKPRHVLMWLKNCPTFSLGRLDYDYQHEPIIFTWGKKHKRVKGGDFQTSVWAVDKPREAKLHPTMKPVELVVNAYLNSSEEGDCVFDAYTGSGTSLIAAEQTNRKFCGMEISPAYCDVIVKRWEDLTGKKAELKNNV